MPQTLGMTLHPPTLYWHRKNSPISLLLPFSAERQEMQEQENIYEFYVESLEHLCYI